MKLEVRQGEVVVAEGEVQTTSSLKPGLVTSLGVGAATGSIGMAAAIGGGTAVASEALLVSVAKDAKQAAKAVAERLIQGYKDRGWLSHRERHREPGCAHGLAGVAWASFSVAGFHGHASRAPLGHGSVSHL